MSRLTAKESRQITRRERAEPVIENLSNIPNRDTLDAHDRLSEGLDRRKLKYRNLTEEEFATNAADGRVVAPDAIKNVHIGEQIAAGKLPNIGGLGGDLPDSKLPNIPANKLPNGTLIGNVQRGNIANNAVHPKDQIDWTVGVDDFIPVSKLASRPWPSVASVRAKTAPPDVVKLIRKYVKPASLQ